MAKKSKYKRPVIQMIINPFSTGCMFVNLKKRKQIKTSKIKTNNKNNSSLFALTFKFLLSFGINIVLSST